MKKVLVLCIDRDDDLGKKAGVKGPVVGRKKVINAAVKLGTADPSDSDVNAIFEAVKVYDELKKAGENVEVAVLTGDSDNVGLKADREVKRQLSKILSKFDADEIVFVSDGASDEQILPIIKSEVDTVYIKRIVVKQSPKLESAYFVIYNFLREISSDPKASRLFIGLPAIALMIYALFGSAGWRLIMGTVATYLLIKGFHLEPYVHRFYNEITDAFRLRRPSLFLYLTAITFTILGVFNGNNQLSGITPDKILLKICYFVKGATFPTAAGIIAWGLGAYLDKKIKKFHKFLSLSLIIVSLSFMAYTLSIYIIDETLTLYFMFKPLVVSGSLILAAGIIESHAKYSVRKKR